MGESGLVRLRDLLAGKRELLISYSGGLDSSFLASVARDVLGDRLICVMLDSRLVPRSELAMAEKRAQEMGIAYQVISVDPLSSPEFCASPANRCYLCKKIMCRALREEAARLGIEYVADGLNSSDFCDYRPGIHASEEERIWHPLVEAGMSKGDIRTAARDLGMEFWDQPASACLASRIPYSEPITAEGLARVEASEDFLRSIGFSGFRVRAHGSLARIEVSKDQMHHILENGQEVVEGLRRVGFSYVTLDLAGYRTGSMNEVLRDGVPGDWHASPRGAPQRR
ncbi:MAG: GMP synthase (glutamine-hydrolyzing) subunit B [Methanosaeta sp. PtaB.Bin039]|nr:MAG: GMP synthase (glutamine-hydrolyzing) subunit B [Methanosaeta sp. PtaB.Bin039]